MILYIDTTSLEYIIIVLKQRNKEIIRKKIKAPRRQGERLVPAIDTLLKSKNFELGDIRKITVANSGGSFTSLRIGVVVANALAYSLGCPVVALSKNGQIDDSALKKFGRQSLVKPFYDRLPDIGQSQKLVL